MFEHANIFDCVVTRPTTLFGRSGGTTPTFSVLADFAKANSLEGILRISSTPCSSLHSTHVDDAAAAYLAIATTRRDIVTGQIYNISNNRYETLGEIVAVVEKTHGIKVVYADPNETPEKSPVINALCNFSQWVDSAKFVLTPDGSTESLCFKMATVCTRPHLGSPRQQRRNNTKG